MTSRVWWVWGRSGGCFGGWGCVRCGCRAQMTSPAARRMTAARAPGKRFSPLPGFDLAMGVTLAWVGLLVALPLTALTLRPWELGIAGFVASISSPRVLAALRLSFVV